jgi:hypothetical protein
MHCLAGAPPPIYIFFTTFDSFVIFKKKKIFNDFLEFFHQAAAVLAVSKKRPKPPMLGIPFWVITGKTVDFVQDLLPVSEKIQFLYYTILVKSKQTLY